MHRDRFHVLESAAAVPNGRGDLLRDDEAIGRQIDVVRDQRHPRAYDRHAGGWMRHRRSEVGRPAFRGHLPCQTFELAAADVLQILARRVRGRLFVEICRYLKALGDGSARSPCERGALRHRDAVDRHKRHAVHAADSGVHAALRPAVDRRHGPIVDRVTACSTPVASPAIVNTDRLCETSEE